MAIAKSFQRTAVAYKAVADRKVKRTCVCKGPAAQKMVRLKDNTYLSLTVCAKCGGRKA